MTALLVALSLGILPQSAAARQAAREVVKAFGREAVEQAEVRVARLIESYGDDVARALSKSGPAGVALIERFGPAGVRILSRWGDDGARLLASEGDTVVRLLGRHGDDAVGLMIRHPGVGREFLEQFGEHAVRSRLSTESVVVMNRLADPLKKSGELPRIFAVVERFGDRACQFIWRNKGTIFATAVLVAFLSDPQPYIEGVKELVGEPASEAAQEAVRRTNWTVVVIVFGLAAAAWLSWRLGLWRRRATLDSPAPPP